MKAHGLYPIQKYEMPYFYNTQHVLRGLAIQRRQARSLQPFQPEDSSTCCSEVFPNSNIELCGQNKQDRKLFWAKEPGRECDVGPENRVKWPRVQPTQCWQKFESFSTYVSR